ncbi:MAG: hypothetical protein ABW252_07665 [Polyangiales bacterium]
MDESSLHERDPSEVPGFDPEVSRKAAPCRPRGLFRALFLDVEESHHCLRAAYRFARAALAAEPPALGNADVETQLDQLIATARAEVAPPPLDGHAFGWSVRVVREFAPVGLADGGWLRGAARLPAPTRASALRQLAVRLGAEEGREAYAQRYAALLRSLGIAPDAIARWEFDESPQCADASYEHALLGLCLGAFPAAFGAEILGFNLWMAAVGPCPLLVALDDELALRSAATRYFTLHARGPLPSLARESAGALLASGDKGAGVRLRRGFAAAHASYLRWQRAMVAGNVPFTPREFVLEGVRRKARFAAEHHRDITLKGENLEVMFLDGGAAYDRILDHMAATVSLVRPGAPDKSPFMTHALSLDGPMFDAFTPPEKDDLREWIATLGTPAALPRPRSPEPLVGRYEPHDEPQSLAERARQRHADITPRALAAALVDGDASPLLASFARAWAEARVAKLHGEADDDADVPPYDDDVLAALAQDAPRTRAPCLVVGLADVARIESEEVRLLLARHVAAPRERVSPAATDAEVLALVMSLHARAFLPELLGVQLADDPRAEAAVDAYLCHVEDAAPHERDAAWARIWRAARFWREACAR